MRPIAASAAGTKTALTSYGYRPLPRPSSLSRQLPTFWPGFSSISRCQLRLGGKGRGGVDHEGEIAGKGCPVGLPVAGGPRQERHRPLGVSHLEQIVFGDDR